MMEKYQMVCVFSLLYLQMDELACFAPGMLALGSTGYGPDEARKFLLLAEEVYTNILSFPFKVLYIVGS